MGLGESVTRDVNEDAAQYDEMRARVNENIDIL